MFKLSINSSQKILTCLIWVYLFYL
jgi:hypothetical protein